MIEAVHTYASPATIWAIVVIMSLVTAFLVAATSVADVVQSRASRRRHMLLHAGPGPARDGAVGADQEAAGVPSQRTPQDMLTGSRGSRGQGERRAPQPGPAQAQGQGQAQGQAQGQGQGQGQGAPARPPAQRSGESDRAARSSAGPDSSDRDEADRP